MVMHARKLPRIDDGYTDKREAQSYQSSQYPSKASYSNHSERYERRRSPGSDIPASRDSPRYLNKSSYIERNKEKYERGNTASPGRRANNNYAGSGNHSNSGNHNSGQDKIVTRSASSSKQKTETPVQKSAIRTCGDWSEHVSSTGKPYYYNLKTEVSQWEKPRDWTDSSTPRHERHSVDSRTSNDKHGTKDVRNRHSSGANEKREKHLGGLRHMVQDGNPKPDKMFLFEKLQQSQSKLQAEMQANMSNKPLYSADHKEMYRRNDECNTNDYPNSSSRRSRRDSDGARMGRQMSRQETDELDSPDSTPTSHRSGRTPQLDSVLNPLCPMSTANLSISSIPSLITQLSGGQNNQELTNKALQTLQKLQQALSRQIAAHQTSVATQSSTMGSQPTIVQASSHHLGMPHPDDAALIAHHLHSHTVQQGNLAPPPHHTLAAPPHRSPYMDSQSHCALQPPHSSPQTHVTMATTSCIATTTVSGSTSIPITHTGNHFPKGNTVYGKFLGSQSSTQTNYPKVINHDDTGGGEHQGVDGGGGMVVNDRSCCSPTPSDTSSQGAPVLDLDMFSTPTSQGENNLMLSLKQYYNEALVGHVTGWQGEVVEKQARIFGDEALKIGSLIGSQVSVELKRARSLVRVEEIQATLQEQRNLFLAQQIAELENMKPVSSITSFLPSTPNSSS